MKITAQKVRRFVEHPVTRLCLGFILFVSGLSEAYLSLTEDISEFQIGAHHGVLIFGLFTMIASIPDLIEGIGHAAVFFEHREKKGEKSVQGLRLPAQAIPAPGGSADPGNPAEDSRAGRGAHKPEDEKWKGEGQ
jgi:hypothetical protein